MKKITTLPAILMIAFFTCYGCILKKTDANDTISVTDSVRDSEVAAEPELESFAVDTAAADNTPISLDTMSVN